MSSDQPLGIFDSGLGGLSVLRDLQALMPSEDVLYLADNAYCPYGLRGHDEIVERSLLVCGELFDRGAKAIVVACNTASAMAINEIRSANPGRVVVGLEPAVKPAVKLTRSGKVGVLATPRTVAGDRLHWLIDTFANGVEVHSVAGTGLVELVESGQLTGQDVRATLAPLLEPMIAEGIDVFVLGCTHYPFLRSEIEAFVGPEMPVIDSGSAVAKRTHDVLRTTGLLNSGVGSGSVRLVTSGEAEVVGSIVRQLVGFDIPVESAVFGAVVGTTPASTGSQAGR